MEEASLGPRPAASRRRQCQPATVTRPPVPDTRQALPVLETELPRLLDEGV